MVRLSMEAPSCFKAHAKESGMQLVHGLPEMRLHTLRILHLHRPLHGSWCEKVQELPLMLAAALEA